MVCYREALNQLKSNNTAENAEARCLVYLLAAISTIYLSLLLCYFKGLFVYCITLKTCTIVKLDYAGVANELIIRCNSSVLVTSKVKSDY